MFTNLQLRAVLATDARHEFAFEEYMSLRLLMTLLGRQCPDLPADVLFSDLEIEVLQAYAKKTEPASPPCLEMQYVS